MKKIKRDYFKQRVRMPQDFSGDSKTQQHFRDEVNINTIVKRFTQDGNITGLREPRYGFASSQSFSEAMTIVAEAKSHFEELPAETRKAFENDPAKFLDTIQAEDADALLANLGLTEWAEEQKPAEIPAEIPAADSNSAAESA